MNINPCTLRISQGTKWIDIKLTADYKPPEVSTHSVSDMIEYQSIMHDIEAVAMGRWKPVGNSLTNDNYWDIAAVHKDARCWAYTRSRDVLFLGFGKEGGGGLKYGETSFFVSKVLILSDAVHPNMRGLEPANDPGRGTVAYGGFFMTGSVAWTTL